MNLSIHYYILSLSSAKTRLYEGFRDELIDIQNTEFPIYALNGGVPKFALEMTDLQLHDFLHETDNHFAHYFKQDPLRMMLVGPTRHLEIFKSLTAHNENLIGTVKGDYTTTSPHDLGKIVWPIVKLALAGTTNNALHALAVAEKTNDVISGIDDIWDSDLSYPGATLFVEDDYRRKAEGKLGQNGNQLITSEGIWEIFNDVVDIIIEKVLIAGGSIVFMDSNSLINLQRIALIQRP